jgi:hypothetical protein
MVARGGGKRDPDIGGSHKVIDKNKYFELIGHKPHSRQHLFHASKARFRLPCCGRRFGKSKMAGADVQPKLLVPQRRAWIVGPTYDLSEKEFRVVWDDMIIKLKLGQDRRVKRAYNKKQGSMFIEFPWQTRIECRSADHPENLVGESLDHVIMSEAAKHKKDTFERYVRAALADRRGTADFPTTPEGQNWFYRMWQLGQDPGDQQHDSWQFPSWENPYVYPKGINDPEIALIRRTTAPEWFQQEIAADFTAFVGKIYGAFQETVHVRKHVFNPDWPNYIAFDWGYTNPMAAVEFQVSPMGVVYVWREWYKSYLRVEEFLAWMKSTPNPPNYRLDLCFGDSADPGATQEVSIKFHMCISDPRAKSGTVQEKGGKHQSGWREGVDLVNSLLAVRDTSDFIDMSEMTSSLDLSYADSLKQPMLFVDHSCKNTIREFNNYRSPDKGREDQNVREDAQKWDDHALDALRYGLMHVMKLGAIYSLSDMYSVHDFPDQAFTPIDSIGSWADSGTLFHWNQLTF